jgi:hypothetical protein
VEQYTDPGTHDRDALLLITTRSALREAFLDTAAGIEHPLTAVIAERIGDTGQHTAQVLSASVAAAVRIALQRWLRPAAESRAVSGLVVPSGSLPDLLRTALAPLTPALEAAERRPQQYKPVRPRQRGLVTRTARPARRQPAAKVDSNPRGTPVKGSRLCDN